MNQSKNFQLAQDEFSFSQQLRRDFHKNPELGFQEFRTSEIVANQLTEFGFSVQRNVGKTGVVGIVEGDASGPTLLLRFDMDALPIQEIVFNRSITFSLTRWSNVRIVPVN